MLNMTEFIKKHWESAGIDLTGDKVEIVSDLQYSDIGLAQIQGEKVETRIKINGKINNATEKDPELSVWEKIIEASRFIKCAGWLLELESVLPIPRYNKEKEIAHYDCKVVHVVGIDTEHIEKKNVEVVKVEIKEEKPNKKLKKKKVKQKITKIDLKEVGNG